MELLLGYLSVSISVGIAILLICAVCRVWGQQYTTAWKRWLWLVFGFLLLIPAWPRLPWLSVPIPIPVRDGAGSPSVHILENPGAGPGFIGVVESGSYGAGPTGVQLIQMAWLLGAALFLGYHLLRYIWMRRKIVRQSTAVTNVEIQVAFLRTYREMGEQVALLVSDQVSSPVLMGHLRPLLVLPHEAYTREEAVLIMRREAAHLASQDRWLKLFLLVVNALHWLNPCVYLMRKHAEADLELICDDAVARTCSPEEKRRYGEILLDTAQARRGFAARFTGLGGGTRPLKRRIVNLYDEGKKCGAAPLACFVTLAVLLCLVIHCGTASASGTHEVRNPGLHQVYRAARWEERDLALTAVRAVETLYEVDVTGYEIYSYRIGEQSPYHRITLQQGSQSLYTAYFEPYEKALVKIDSLTDANPAQAFLEVRAASLKSADDFAQGLLAAWP